MADLKMNACHCCQGSGEELDHVAVGVSMMLKRKDRGFTQSKVAERMKIGKPYLCDLEAGNRNWRPDLIQKYLKALK